jgi:hypothetical protein
LESRPLSAVERSVLYFATVAGVIMMIAFVVTGKWWALAIGAAFGALGYGLERFVESREEKESNEQP